MPSGHYVNYVNKQNTLSVMSRFHMLLAASNNYNFHYTQMTPRADGLVVVRR